MTSNAEKAAALLEVAQTQLGSGSRFEAVSAASVHAQLAQVDAITQLAGAVRELAALITATDDSLGADDIARRITDTGRSA